MQVKPPQPPANPTSVEWDKYVNDFAEFWQGLDETTARETFIDLHNANCVTCSEQLPISDCFSITEDVLDTFDFVYTRAVHKGVITPDMLPLVNQYKDKDSFRSAFEMFEYHFLTYWLSAATPHI